MFSRLLLVPLVILTLAGLYLSWEISSDYSWTIIVGVVLIALVHVFSPQINWWWYTRYPKDLDGPIIQFLERFDLYYQQLAPMARIRFRQRMALFMMGNEYMPQGWESVPADVEAIIAAYYSEDDVPIGTNRLLLKVTDTGASVSSGDGKNSVGIYNFGGSWIRASLHKRYD